MVNIGWSGQEYIPTRARKQAAAYAKQTGYPDVTIAMFAPFTDEDVLKQWSISETIDGIDVHLVVIGQG